MCVCCVLFDELISLILIEKKKKEKRENLAFLHLYVTCVCCVCLIYLGKFRKEFRRTFRCRCRWLTDHLPGGGRSRSSVSMCGAGGTRLNQSMVAVVRVPTGATAFAAALASTAPASTAVATDRLMASNVPPPSAAACYPLRQCRSNHPTARSIRTLTSTT